MLNVQLCMLIHYKLYLSQLNSLRTIMAVIFPVAMTFFAVFIAGVQGDTCKISPCECSFSNIEILSNYIDARISDTVGTIVEEFTETIEEKFNATVDERIATAIDTAVSAISSESAMWTPVAKTPIGPDRVSLENATTYHYQIPDVIPVTANEFIVYASVICGTVRAADSVISYCMCCTMAYD